MSYLGKENSRHCTTCGNNYTPMLHNDEDGAREIGGHSCPYPHSTFFVEEKIEYEFREGKLFSRKVKFTRYSGHDTNFTSHLRADEWQPHSGDDPLNE